MDFHKLFIRSLKVSYHGQWDTINYWIYMHINYYTCVTICLFPVNSFILQLVNSIAKTYVGTNAYMAVSDPLTPVSSRIISTSPLSAGITASNFVSTVCLFSLHSQRGYQESSMVSTRTSGVWESPWWRCDKSQPLCFFCIFCNMYLGRRFIDPCLWISI